MMGLRQGSATVAIILLMSGICSCIQIDPETLAKSVADQLTTQEVARIAWQDTTVQRVTWQDTIVFSYHYETIFDTTWENIKLDAPINVKLLKLPFTLRWKPPGDNIDWYGEPISRFELACLHNGKLFTGWPSTIDTAFVFNEIPPGVYVMMVRSVDLAGNPSEWVTSLDSLWGKPWIGVVL